MPELPEVEVLARHLAPLLKNKIIRRVTVRRAKVLRPSSETELVRALAGAKFTGLTRRGKYLLFEMRRQGKEPFTLLGHLGMTGRMFVQPVKQPHPKHAAVILHLGKQDFVYEDTRYFGRLTLDIRSVGELGPEPFAAEFSVTYFFRELRRSRQPVKVKLLDQGLVAGVGNIYASEALFRARISPKTPASKITRAQAARLRETIVEVLQEAIDCGSTIPPDFAGGGERDGLFYYGRTAAAPDFYEERLRVYDREGKPCCACGTGIRRIVQAARATYFCLRCQVRRPAGKIS